MVQEVPFTLSPTITLSSHNPSSLRKAMPPTGRRRGRKEVDAANSEAQTPEASNTPSRKRRRVNGADKPNKTTVQRAVSRESDATIENPEGLNREEEEEDPLALAEECIRHLRVSAGPRVNVSVDYNNDIVDKSAQAYAKIAGRNWTYYVADTSVTIGRPNAKHERSRRARDSIASDFSGGDQPNDDFKIHIDLGPDQQISRCHAVIEYSTDSENWVIYCNGRNGLFLDDDRIERGHQKFLRSGAVIGIMGTQMMFLLPTESPVVHPLIKKQLLVDEEDEDQNADQQNAGGPQSASKGRNGRQSNASYQQGSASKGTTSARSTQQNLAASSSQHQPGTPVSSRGQTQPKSNKQSPLYARGLMLESTEEIDYSLDSAKDIKPPYSYAQMIGQAILSSPDENATLSKIYEFIRERYAFFRHNGAGWQNSIRHNLSLSKSFEKIPRRTDEPGKGMKWRIVDEFREDFVKKTMIQSYRKQVHANSAGRSGPNSPANLGVGPAAQTERLLGAIGSGEGTKDSPLLKSSPLGPRSSTPPLHSYHFPSAHESFTPDRGPARPSALRTSNLPQAANGLSANSAELATPGRVPLFAPNSVGPPNRAVFNYSDAVNSPSGNLYEGPGVFTPIVHRSKPSIMPQPSTVKMPSHYAKDLFSSPAPFWKYIDMGSTPGRPPPDLDLSPTKTDMKSEDDQKQEQGDGDVDMDEEMDDVDEGSDHDDGITADIEAVTDGQGEDAADEEKQEAGGAPVQPSSPPVLEPGSYDPADEDDASPSRSLSRPASCSNGGIPTAKSIAAKALHPTHLFPPPTQPAFGKPMNMRDLGPAINPYTTAKRDSGTEEDDEGIDLAR